VIGLNLAVITTDPPVLAFMAQALALALMFLLGPDVRFGYFIYPIGLLGWLALTQPRLECGRLVR
jgi:hypothetical protein